jgi:hypothetical protein
VPFGDVNEDQPRARLAHNLGLAGMFGGVLFVVIYLTLTVVGTAAFGTEYTFNVASAFPVVFWVAGTAGLYLRHRRVFGWLGRVGTSLLLAGFGVSLANSGAYLVTGSGLVSAAGAVGYLAAEAVGTLLVGVAVARAGELPNARRDGLLFAVALPFSLVVFTLVFQVAQLTSNALLGVLLFTVPYGIAWVLLGYDLLSEAPTGMPGAASDLGD